MLTNKKMPIEFTASGKRLDMYCPFCRVSRGIEGHISGNEFKAIIKSWLDEHSHKMA